MSKIQTRFLKTERTLLADLKNATQKGYTFIHRPTSSNAEEGIKLLFIGTGMNGNMGNWI